IRLSVVIRYATVVAPPPPPPPVPPVPAPPPPVPPVPAPPPPVPPLPPPPGLLLPQPATATTRQAAKPDKRVIATSSNVSCPMRGIYRAMPYQLKLIRECVRSDDSCRG